MTKFKGLIVFGIIVMVCVLGAWVVFSNINSGPTNHKVVNLIEQSTVDLVFSDPVVHSFDAPLKSDFWSMFGLDFNIATMHVKATGKANFVINKFNIKSSEDGFIVELKDFQYKGFEFTDLDTDSSGVPSHIKDENLDDVTNKLHGYVDDYIKGTYMVDNKDVLKQNIKSKLSSAVISKLKSEFGNTVKVSFVWL